MDLTEQRREYYRLDYPAAERPTFVTESLEFEVADVSERGLGLVVTPETPVLGDGEAIHGTLRFRHAPPLEIEGTVVRHEPGLLGIKLRESVVPWPSVLLEQRQILRRYQAWG